MANEKIQIVDRFSSAIENGREIIGTIPANHENMTKFSSIFDIGFIRIVSTLTRWLDAFKSKSSENVIDSERVGDKFANKLDDLHCWLNPAPSDLELAHLLDCRATNTQNHLLDQSVTGWFQLDRGLLQINGDTGYGKTMSAASIIERASSNGPLGSFIGYVFCSKLKFRNVLQSLVWQIVQNRYLTADQKSLILEAHRIRRVPRDHTIQTERQETSDLCSLIAKLLQSYRSVTLLFDGVDQLALQEDIVPCISFIVDSLLPCAKPLKVLITCRQSPRGLQRTTDSLGLQNLSLTSSDVTRDAETYVRQSLSSLEPPLSIGADQPVILSCLNQADDGWPYVMHTLARHYVILGRPNEAEGLIIEVLSFRETRQRENSDPILASKRILVHVLAEQGRRGEAEDLQRSLLEICRQTRGDGDHLTIAFTNDLTNTLSHRDATRKKKREAITLLEQISEVGKTPEGEETERSLTVANNLAVAYIEANRFEEAEAVMHRVITGSALIHGDNSEVSLSLKSNLGQLLARQQKWAEAEALQLEVLEIQKSSQGMDNPITIQFMSSLGWTYSQYGRWQEAKELQLEVLNRRMQLQGPTHPDTISILGNLAETVSKLGEMKDARRYAKMALGY